MKIALIGASSTGKTTLSRELAKSLALPLIREQARVVLSEMGRSLQEIRKIPADILKFQLSVLDHQIASELECAESGFVSDRSVFDNLTLYLRHCPNDKPGVDFYRTTVLNHYFANPYDILLFLRPGEFPMESDGVRTPDPLYQMQVDGMILLLLKLYSVPCFEVHGTLTERVLGTKEIIEMNFPGWLEKHLSNVPPGYWVEI
jgi:predicted ATPase